MSSQSYLTVVRDVNFSQFFDGRRSENSLVTRDLPDLPDPENSSSEDFASSSILGSQSSSDSLLDASQMNVIESFGGGLLGGPENPLYEETSVVQYYQ